MALANAGGPDPEPDGSLLLVPRTVDSTPEFEALTQGAEQAQVGPITDPTAAEGLPQQSLDRQQAEDLLTAVFPSVIEDASGIFGDLEIEKFHSDHVVVVSNGAAGNPSGLLTSLLPLRDEVPEGGKEPVDLKLESVGENLSPANPLVDVEIPTELSAGVELPEAGVTISLAGNTDRQATTIDEGAAFYPNVAADSDLVILPTPTGVETFTQLRSSASPTVQHFHLGAPTGSTLESTEDGGAIVNDHGDSVLVVRPPTAIDAEGRAVPVRLEIDGSTLSVVTEVPQGAAYPILVDPLFESYKGVGFATPNASNSDWVAATTNPTYFGWRWGGIFGPASKPGLGLTSGQISAGLGAHQSNFNYYVPRYFSDFQDAAVQERPTSFIRKMTLSEVYFIREGSTPYYAHPYMLAGLWDGNKGAFASIATNLGTEIPWTNATVYLENDGEYTTVKNGGIALGSTEGRSQLRQAFVGQATVELSDKDMPAWAKLISPGVWMKDQPLVPLDYQVADSGLGIQALQLRAPRATGGVLQSISSNSCTGIVSNSCPRQASTGSRTLTYDPASMAQGENVISVTATDPVDNKSAPRLAKIKVDHTSPDLDLSGNLTEQGTVGTSLPAYTLDYSASDGDDAPAAAQAPIGTKGTAAGQLERPQGLAVDDQGNVWVTDRVNNRVVQYDRNGTFIRQFGSKGSADGQISEPRGIAIAPSGNIWVAEAGNKRLQQFSPTGSFVSKITNTAFGNAFSEPWGVVTGPEGILWVTDPVNKKVYRYKEDGTLTRTISSFDGLSGVPYGIDVDAFGNAWVAMQGTNRVIQIKANGDIPLSLEPVRFDVAGVPVDVAVAASGNVLVSDDLNSRVQAFKPDGTLLRQFGSAGSAGGQLKEPRSLDVGLGNTAFIADAGNSRISSWGHADQDPQSGAAKVVVKVDGAVVKTDSPGCATKNCSLSGSWTLDADDFPVGPHKVAVTATDGVGLEKTKTLDIETHGDRQAPAIALSGPMTEQASLGTTRPAYRLRVKAIDPVSAGGRQSGVASTVVRVDGQVVDSASPGCTGGGCSLIREWTLNSNGYSVGSHTVEVKATDEAGRSTTKTLGINIERDTTAPVFDSLGALYTAPSGWVEQKLYGFTAAVSDQNGYGVTSVQLKIDGSVVKEQVGSCAEGGCEGQLGGFLQKIDMSAYDGGSHVAELIATDGAGNKRKRTWTINVDPSGQISPREATDTMEAVELTAPESTQAMPVSALVTTAPGEEGSNPQLALNEGSLVSTGTPTPTTVSLDPAVGFTVKTMGRSLEGVSHEEDIEIVPTLLSTAASDPEITDGSAAVISNSAGHTDTIMRPAFDGLMSFQAIRDATGPESYSWEVTLGEDETLELLDARHAAVVWGDGTQAMLITAQSAHGADGEAVPTTIAVSEGNVITLTVHHRTAQIVYPVVAGVGWQGGFQTKVATVSNPAAEEHETIFGEPTMVNTHVSAPIHAPMNEPGEDANASEIKGWRLKRNWGVDICSPLGCSPWKNNFRGYFYYNYYEAWYPRNRDPKCTPASNFHYSVDITECAWVGPNEQPYGNGYHITARTRFQVTAHHPDPVPDVTSGKAVTGRAYGSGNIYFHKTDDICNPNTSC